MGDDPIDRMRERIAQCRRLAEFITDPKAAATLRQMADEGEIDIRRLEAERKVAGEPPPVSAPADRERG